MRRSAILTSVLALTDGAAKQLLAASHVKARSEGVKKLQENEVQCEIHFEL